VASKPGYKTYEQRIEFEDGQAERTFIIDLESGGSASSAEENPLPPVAANRSSSTSSQSAPSTPRTSGGGGEAKSGKAKLNFNSIPSSNVILDGKPLGPTPKSASVDPGMHTVIFVHPEKGRKAKGVNASAGKTISVVAKFD
jgi:hypothetical protein